MSKEKRFRAVALTLIGSLIIQMSPMVTWASEGSLNAIHYNRNNHTFSFLKSGDITATLHSVAVGGNQRLIIDLENAEVGLTLPRDALLLKGLQSEWSMIRKVFVSQFGGANSVVRIIIELTGDGYSGRLTQANGSVELSVAPKITRATSPSVERGRLAGERPRGAASNGLDPVAYQRALNTVEVLRGEKAILQGQLAQAADKLVQIDQLRQRLAALQEALGRAEAQKKSHEALSNRYQHSRQLIGDLRGKLAHYQEKITVLERAQNSPQISPEARNKIRQLETELQSLGQENSQLRVTLSQRSTNENREQAQRLSNRIAELENQIRSLKMANQQHRSNDSGQLQRLRKSVAQLEGQVRSLSDENQLVKTEYGKLQSLNRSLEQSLKRERASQPSFSIDDMKKTIAVLNRKYNEQLDENKRLQANELRLDYLKKELERAKGSLERSVDIINQQNREIAGLNERLNDLKGGLEQAARDQITILNDKLEMLEADNQRLRSYNKSLKEGLARHGDFEETMLVMNRRIQELEREREALKKNIASQGGERSAKIQTLSQQLASLESDRNALQSKYASLHQEKERLKQALTLQGGERSAKIQTLSQQLASLESDRNALQSKYASLHQEKERLKQALTLQGGERSAKIQTLSQQLASLESDRNALQSKYATLHQEKERLKQALTLQDGTSAEKLQVLTAEINRLNTQHNDLKKQYMSVKGENQRIGTAMNQRIAELEAEKKVLQSSMFTQGSDSAEQIHAMSSQITLVTKENVTIRGQLENLQTRLALLLKENTGLERDLKSLLASGTTGETHHLMKNRMDELQDALAASAAERAMLRNTVKNLVTSLESANNKLKAVGGGQPATGNIEENPTYIKLASKNEQQKQQLSQLLARIRDDEAKYAASVEKSTALQNELERLKKTWADTTQDSSSSATFQQELNTLKGQLTRVNEQYEKTLAQTHTLQDELAQVKSRLALSSQDHSDASQLQERVSTLESQLRTAESKYQAVANEAKVTKSQLEQVKQQLTQSTSGESQGQASQAKLEGQIERLQQEIRRANGQTESVRAELMKTKALLASATQGQAAVSNLQNQVVELQGKLTQAEANHKTAVQETQTIKAKLAETKQLLTNAQQGQTDVNALNQRITNLQAQLEKTTNGYERGQSEMASLKAELEQTKQLLADASRGQADLTSMQDRIAILQRDLRESNNNYQKSTQRSKTLEQQLKQVQEKLIDASQEHEELLALRGEEARLSTLLAATKRQNSTLETQNKTVTKELAETKNLLTHALQGNSQLTLLQQELADMTAKLAQSDGNKEALEEEASSLRTELTRTKALLENASQGHVELASLQAKLKTLNKELQSANQDKATLANEADTLKSAAQVLRSKVASLQEELNSAQQRLANVSSDSSQAQDRTQALQDEAIRLKDQLVEAQSDYQSLQQDSSFLKQELEEARGELAKASANVQKDQVDSTEVSGLKQKITSLTAELEQTDDNYRQALGRLTPLQNELDQTKQQLDRALLASHSSSSDNTIQLEGEISQLKSDLQRAIQARENAEVALKRAKSKNIIPSEPNSRAERYYVRGQELQDNGKSLEATVMFRDAYKLEPNRSEYATTYAEGLLQTGNYGEATRILEGFVANSPYDLEAYNLLGKAHLLNGRIEDAQQAFSLAIPVSVLNNYATTLKKMGRIEEAERIFLVALSLNPNDSDLLFNLGNLYNSTTALQKAKNAYEQAIALRPDFSAAHYNLGLVYSRLEDRQKALKHLKRFLELSPNARNGDVVRKYIQKLQG